MEELLKQLVEGQKQILEHLEHVDARTKAIETRLDRVESKIDTVDEKIDRYGQEQQNDVMTMLKIMNEKLDKQSEILKILSSRSIEQEAEISVLKRAK